MIVSALIGVVIERFAYKPVRRSPRLSALITAIGVSLLLENGWRAGVPGADPKFFPQHPVAQHPAAPRIGVDLTSELIVLVVSLGLMVLFACSSCTRGWARPCRRCRTTTWPRLMGISVDRIITFTFMIGRRSPPRPA